MRKNGLLKLTALLLTIALLASTYAWMGCREKNERLMEDIYLDSTHSQLVLSHMAGFLNGSIENNASDAYLWWQLVYYDEHAIFLGDVFFDLYKQTGEQKYYTLYTAVSNIVHFLTDISNDNPPEKRRVRVEDNLKTIERLQELFRELLGYQKPEKIPNNLAEELLKVSGELK